MQMLRGTKNMGSLPVPNTDQRMWLVLGPAGDYSKAACKVPMMGVKCFSGRGVQVPANAELYDLTPYTEFLPKRHNQRGGLAPLPAVLLTGRADALYNSLEEAFCRLLGLITARVRGAKQPVTIFFFCRAGRHRSAAMLTLFLMWVTGALNPAVIETVQCLKPDVQFFDENETSKAEHVPFATMLQGYMLYSARRCPFNAFGVAAMAVMNELGGN